ncbi:hypothetical protein BDS110ZK25_68440 [Bradyrhizobium diazoefficiens]
MGPKQRLRYGASSSHRTPDRRTEKKAAWRRPKLAPVLPPESSADLLDRLLSELALQEDHDGLL